MSHYWDDVPQTEDEIKAELDRKARIQSGFDWVNGYTLGQTALECLSCGAIVMNWKLHRKRCQQVSK